MIVPDFGISHIPKPLLEASFAHDGLVGTKRNLIFNPNETRGSIVVNSTPLKATISRFTAITLRQTTGSSAIRRSAALPKVVRKVSPNLWAHRPHESSALMGKEGRRSQSNDQLLFCRIFILWLCARPEEHTPVWPTYLQYVLRRYYSTVPR